MAGGRRERREIKSVDQSYAEARTDVTQDTCSQAKRRPGPSHLPLRAGARPGPTSPARPGDPEVAELSAASPHPAMCDSKETRTPAQPAS